MADEEDEGRRRMDLNLYLGLPRSQTFDLGSDLALGSLPLSPTDEMEITTNHLLLHHHHHHRQVPYSPTDATFSPGPIFSPTLDSPLPLADHQENTTYIPSPMIPVPGFSPVSSSPDSVVPIEIEEPESPPSSPEPPSRTGPFFVPPSPEPHPTATATGPIYVPQSPFYFPPRSWSYIPLDFEEPHQSVSVRRFSRTYRQTPLDQSPTPPYSPPSLPYVRTLPTEESLGREEEDDESPSQRNQLQSPEFRFRRLIESNHRLRVRRFRSSVPYTHSNRSGIGRDSSSGPEEELMLGIMRSQRSLGRNGKHKVLTGSVTTESSEEGKEENNNKSAANFECNVCLDVAEDPVVTSCGHLFCWPCLYQWLHVHSDHKECPVCKGEVTEPNIIPIYGRGSSGASDGKELLENGDMGLKIPPRPGGNRQESLRQQFRPTPRRFAEGIVSPNVSEQIAVINRMRTSYNTTREVLNPGIEAEESPVPESIIPGVLTSGQIGFWRRRSRAGLRAESGPETEDSGMSRESAAVSLGSSRVPLFRDGISVRRRLSIYDYATAEGVAPNTWRSDDRFGESSSYVDARRSERRYSWANVASASGADQASASSTPATIRGDIGGLDGSV